jgi:hypothetical protein
MSKLSFKTFFNNFLNNCLNIYEKMHRDDIICIGLCISHYIYSTKTVDTKYINIDKKYKYTKNGFTKFMIVDDNGKHYHVGNSLWFWKWNSIEEWNELETNKEIIIKYYGFRYPLFGFFPKIVMTDQSNLFYSISTSKHINMEHERQREKEKLDFDKKRKLIKKKIE